MGADPFFSPAWNRTDCKPNRGSKQEARKGEGEQTQRSEFRERGRSVSRERERGRRRGTSLSQLARQAADLQQSLDTVAGIQRTHFGSPGSPDAASSPSPAPTSLGSASEAPAQSLALQSASLGYFGRGGSAPGKLQHTQVRPPTPGPPPRGRRPVPRTSRSRARSPQSDTALVSTSAGSEGSPQGSGGKRRGLPESEQVQSFPPKRPGRPRAYQGDDPDNDPNLTEEQRRRIRRRAANRASARRVRDRKLKEHADQEAQGMELQAQHSVLTQRLSEAGEEHERLTGQLYNLRGTYSAAAAEGSRLEDQLSNLRSQASGGVVQEQEPLQEDLDTSMASGWAQGEDAWPQLSGVQREALPESSRGARLSLEAPLMPSPGRSFPLPSMQYGTGMPPQETQGEPSAFGSSPFMTMPLGGSGLPFGLPPAQLALSRDSIMPAPQSQQTSQEAVDDAWAAMDFSFAGGSTLLPREGTTEDLPMMQMPSTEPADEAVTAVELSVGLPASSMQQAGGGAELDAWDTLFGSGDVEDNTAPKKTFK